MTTRIARIEVLEGMSRKDEALSLIKQVASWVEPIMKNHDWMCPLLVETNFRQPNILGMNVNKGQKIMLRLRPVQDKNSFFELEMLIDTMLHELSHNVHSNHGPAFHELWDQLRKEYDANRAKGLKGTGQGFDAVGHKLSAERHNPQSVQEARERALKAAEARKRQEELMGGPRKLGGGEALKGLDAREAVRLATLKREAEWCGVGHNKEEQEEEEEEEVVVVKQEEEPVQKKAKNKEEEEVVVSARTWTCQACTFENAMETVVCEICETPKEGMWKCEACTMVNDTLFAPCKGCEKPRGII